MNKNYILLGDKVIVIDDKFKLSERDNSITIKEELTSENIIEYLTNYLKDTKDDLRNKIYFLKNYLPLIGTAVFSVPSLCYLAGYLSNNITDMDTFMVVLLILLGEGVVAISGHNIRVDNDRLKVLESIISEELDKEKIKSDKLRDSRELVSTPTSVEVIKDDYLIDTNKRIEEELSRRLIKRRKI